MTITLNGDPHVVDGPLTVGELLTRLDIDPRRVAVEHNLIVLKRAAFDHTTINAGDQVEIVNFVGGGAASNEASLQNRGEAGPTVPRESSWLVARPSRPRLTPLQRRADRRLASHVIIRALEGA